MPGLWQEILQKWYVGTGFALSRGGGHAPVVSGMVVNGKSYVVVTSGSGWQQAAAVLETDLSTLAHESLNIAYGINRAWSYGAWVDWYWDEDESAAYLAIWFGRVGLFTYKLTCFE
jgi:hypothetical protein